MELTLRHATGLLCLWACLPGFAQLQQGVFVQNVAANSQYSAGYTSTSGPAYGLYIADVGAGCLDNYFSMVPPAWPINWPSNDSGSEQRYWSLPGTRDAQGNSQFEARVVISRNDIPATTFTESQSYLDALWFPRSWSVLIDGVPCTTCAVEELSSVRGGIRFGAAWFINPHLNADLRITHQAGDSWAAPHNGKRHFTIRLNILSQPQVDIRFNAIMVGTNFTSVLGYFDAPQVPLFILRDPPGDRSYSSITNTQQTCFGQTFSVSTDASATVWAKAKVGTEGSVGFIVETDYELYGEVGVDLTVGMSATAEEEYQTCLETTTEFTTGNGDLEEGEDVPGDDVFMEARCAMHMA